MGFDPTFAELLGLERRGLTHPPLHPISRITCALAPPSLQDAALSSARSGPAPPNPECSPELKDGKEEYRNIGFRELAKHDEAPDAETLYLISSMTKPFLAMALCMLVAEGRISLHDYVDDIVLHKVSHGHQLLVRDLIDHTTSWPRYNGTSGLEMDTFEYSAPKCRAF